VKWIRRLLLGVTCLLLTLIVCIGVMYPMYMGRPGFYHTYQWDGEQRGRLATNTINKIISAHDMATEARRLEDQRREALRRGLPPPPATAVGAVTQTFTEEELNAFFLNYSTTRSSKLDQYIAQPGIFLHEGRIILAATAKGLGAKMGSSGDPLVSLHFQPSVDAQSGLKLDLKKILGGRLPLPRVLVDGQLTRLKASLNSRLGPWQRQARIDARGNANTEAVSAQLAKLLLNSLAGQSSPAVLFVPSGSGGYLAVRITRLEVHAGPDARQVLTIQVEPLDAQAREKLLDQIRQPLSLAPGMAPAGS